MYTDEKYIATCLRLAAKGKGKVSPNPLVGCVLVKNGEIIGKGYHQRFGGPHAEINAFTNASEDVTGATLYVNLEPCSHYGKTPPCADTIISKKISRVVIGTVDPNPLVAGKGIQKLRDAGIEVISGVLTDDCRELNKFFFKYIRTKLPYVTLKAGQSIDGRIAAITGDSKWITSEESRTLVHKMRAEYDAVLIGPGTAKADNPELTVRMVKGRNPRRIVIDKNLSLPLTLKLFTENPEKNVTIITTGKASGNHARKVEKLQSLGVQLLPLNAGKSGELNPKQILREIGKLKIASLLVEGGSGIYTSFLKAGIVDELCLFISPRIIGDGISAIGYLGTKRIKGTTLWQLWQVDTVGGDIRAILRK